MEGYQGFFVVLVVVILVIRGLAKLGTGDGDEPPRRRSHRKATKPPKKPVVSRGATHVPKGVSHKSASASAKPGAPRAPKVRRPIFGRRQTPQSVKAPPAQGPGSETYVRYLLDVLRVGEPAASRQAVERLVGMGKAALPALQSAARDSSPFVRERAQQASRRIMEALALPGQPDARPRLEEEPIALPAPDPTPPTPPAPRPGLFDRRPSRPEPASPEAPETLPVPEAAEVVEAAEVLEDVVPEAIPEPERPAPPVEVAGGEGEVAPPPNELETIARILREAEAEPGFSGRRDEILEPLKLVIAHFPVVVDRVQWTGSLGVTDRYRGGRTVGGRIGSVDLPVAVYLPKDRNAFADALKEGDTFDFRGVFVSWDGMYDRGKFEGDLLEEPGSPE